MSDHWSREEVEAAVADYLDMLSAELRGDTVNKADHNRRLRQVLTRRTKGSIERKHQNISAILILLGYPYISGYKPLKNYQELLASVVQERLEVTAAAGLDKVVQDVVTASVVPKSQAVQELLSMEVKPPVRPAPYEGIREPAIWQPLRSRRNYLEIEARNQSLGLAGELMAMNFEHERLWRAGCKHLAERIEHVAQTKGDHLGFDILSFETSGAERMIEVKTTRFGGSTPFFVTANEVSVSKSLSNQYQLYRLFDFAREPQLFRLSGAIDDNCTLKASQFIAMAW